MNQKNYLVLLGSSLAPCVLYSLSLLILFFAERDFSLFPGFRLDPFTVTFWSTSFLCIAAFSFAYLANIENLNWFERLSHFCLWTLFSILMLGVLFFFTGAVIIVFDGFPPPG